MININIDTTQFKQCGQDLMKLSNSLNEQLNGLFRELENLEKIGAWTGSASRLYSSKVRREKTQFYNFKNSIYKDGKTACDISTYIETEMGKIA